jgi:hypothetical protein
MGVLVVKTIKEAKKIKPEFGQDIIIDVFPDPLILEDGLSDKDVEKSLSEFDEKLAKALDKRDRISGIIESLLVKENDNNGKALGRGK